MGGDGLRGTHALAHGAEALRGFDEALPPGRDLVLVPHSNSGLYVPALAAERRVVAAVFVDAGVPAFEGGAAALAPPAFLDFLATLADDTGVLPPWTRWWPDDDTAGLFPSRAAREQVEWEQHRLPMAYFRDSVPVPAGWADDLRCGYLAFGETYADERRRAAEAGWPTRTLEGRHLHQLVAPDAVAAAVTDLLAAVGHSRS